MFAVFHLSGSFLRASCAKQNRIMKQQILLLFISLSTMISTACLGFAYFKSTKLVSFGQIFSSGEASENKNFMLYGRYT